MVKLKNLLTELEFKTPEDFKKYKAKIGSEDNVTYLNPSETNDGYFVETGWASSNLGKISVPTIETLWKIILSDGKSDIYENNLMRRLAGLLYLDDKLIGETKVKILNNK